jgi:hypothetical protein
MHACLARRIKKKRPKKSWKQIIIIILIEPTTCCWMALCVLAQNFGKTWALTVCGVREARNEWFLLMEFYFKIVFGCNRRNVFFDNFREKASGN